MLATELAQFVYSTDYESLPHGVVASVKRSLVDTVGVAAGAVEHELSRALLGWGRAPKEPATCEVFSTLSIADAAWAAFLNGTLAHTLDFDDTHLPTILHPTSCVMPAALAAAQVRRATFGELITAVACGSEVSIRIAMAGYDQNARVSRFVERGWHPTSVCGALGSAAAAAKLFGLDAAGVQHSLSIAVSMASGVIEPNRSGGNVKRVHAGWAAHAGVMAAELAARGFTGPESAIEGRFGLYAAYLSGAPDAERVTRDVGEVWDVCDVGIKPYPCNVFTHSAIDAALEISRKGVRSRDVLRILVQVPSAVVPIVGEPIESKRQPGTSHEARFSVPYVVAAALLGGGGIGVGCDDFSEDAIRLPERLALASRVYVQALPSLDASFPEQLPAVVTVESVDGARHIAAVDRAKGSPQAPLTDEQVRRKFVSVVAGTLGRTAAIEWLQRFDSWDLDAPVDGFLRPLSGTPR